MPRKLWVARKELSTQRSAKLLPSTPLQQEQESTNSRPERGECSLVWFESDMCPQAHASEAGSQKSVMPLLRSGAQTEEGDVEGRAFPGRGAGLSRTGATCGFLYSSSYLLVFPMCRSAPPHSHHHHVASKPLRNCTFPSFPSFHCLSDICSSK